MWLSPQDFPTSERNSFNRRYVAELKKKTSESTGRCFAASVFAARRCSGCCVSSLSRESSVSKKVGQVARDRSGAVNLRGNEPVYAVSGVSLPASQPPAPPLLLSSLTGKVAKSAAQPSPAVRPQRSCFHGAALTTSKYIVVFRNRIRQGCNGRRRQILNRQNRVQPQTRWRSRLVRQSAMCNLKLTTAGEYRRQLKKIQLITRNCKLDHVIQYSQFDTTVVTY